MARGRFITEFERDCIRIGKSEGIENATIARALKRTPASIGQQIGQMEDNGTIDNLMLAPVADEIADMLKRAGRKK